MTEYETQALRLLSLIASGMAHQVAATINAPNARFARDRSEQFLEWHKQLNVAMMQLEETLEIYDDRQPTRAASPPVRTASPVPRMESPPIRTALPKSSRQPLARPAMSVE